MLPGSPGACRDAWDGILKAQLDYRHMPCNFVEIMPRLDEHLRRGDSIRRARDQAQASRQTRDPTYSKPIVRIKGMDSPTSDYVNGQ